MVALRKASKLIKADPESSDSVALSELISSVVQEQPVDLASAYQLCPRHFEVFLEMVSEWRLARYHASSLHQSGALALFSSRKITEAHP